MDISTPINHVENQILTAGEVPQVLLNRGGDGAEKGSWTQTSHNHGGSVGSTALSAAEIPPHSHNMRGECKDYGDTGGAHGVLVNLATYNIATIGGSY